MIRSLLQSKWFTIAIVLFAVVLTAVIAEREPKLASMLQETKQLDDRILELNNEQTNLEQRQAYYSSDAYLEEQARLKLNYKKPGEKVVFVYRSSKSQDIEQKPEVRTLTNVELWWYYLLGREK